MYDLSDKDFLILRYIADRKSVSIPELSLKFPDIASLEYRVIELATPQYESNPHGRFRLPIPNSSYLLEENCENVKAGSPTDVEPLGRFSITPLGRKALQDYECRMRTAKKELWLKNAWIPIIVSFVTTVLTNYLLPRLPQILRWLANILSRIFS